MVGERSNLGARGCVAQPLQAISIAFATQVEALFLLEFHRSAQSTMR